MANEKYLRKEIDIDSPPSLTSEDFFTSIQSELDRNYWLQICRLKGVKFPNYWSHNESTEKTVADFKECHLFVESILNSKDMGFIDKGVDEQGSFFQYERSGICFLYDANGFLTRFGKKNNDTSWREILPISPSAFVALRLNLEKILIWDIDYYPNRMKKPMSELLHSVEPSETNPVLVPSAPRIILEKIAIDLAYPDTRVAPEYLSEPMLFNLVLDLTRKLAARADFKKFQKQRLQSAENSRLSAIDYVEALMSHHKSLLVFRLNCFVPFLHGYISSAKPAKAMLKKMANNRRNNALFNDMAGYIWKLDYHFKLGYYLHFIFFYQVNPWTSIHTLSHQIGHYWQNKLGKGSPQAFYLTEDELPQGRLMRRFGTVSKNNHQLRWHLDQLIHYLSHKDVYLKFNRPKLDSQKFDGSSKEKCFGRGLLPSEGLTDSEEVSESGAIPEV